MKNHCEFLKFGLFLMLFNSIYKAVLCLMRRHSGKTDKVNAPVAGFLSGLSIAGDVSRRRQLFAVLMMSRAIDASLLNFENKGTLPKFKFKSVLLWVIGNVICQGAMCLNDSILNKGLFKFYKQWSQMTPNDDILRKTWIRSHLDGVPGF